ncbi:MAG: hypothetical protein HYU75_09825 [Betaproteobacteria bacterium]|nr:hypothetical protein [Betaproteobacteria bacterium]
MKALTQSIATSARERQMAVGDSRVQTARMLQAFGRERAVMAKILNFGLVADRVVRSVNVCALRADGGALRERLLRDHGHMRRSLRRRLGQSSEAVATFVAALRADFAKGRVDVAKAHRHMARAQRAGLAKDRRDRSREVAELINDFHLSRGEMARELAESLAKSTQDIRSHVSGLNEWCRASLQKSRGSASPPRQIPSHLLASQGGGTAQGPSSTLRPEPEEHHEKAGKKKMAADKALRAFDRMPGKPKQK